MNLGCCCVPIKWYSTGLAGGVEPVPLFLEWMDDRFNKWFIDLFRKSHQGGIERYAGIPNKLRDLLSVGFYWREYRPFYCSSWMDGLIIL